MWVRSWASPRYRCPGWRSGSWRICGEREDKAQQHHKTAHNFIQTPDTNSKRQPARRKEGVRSGPDRQVRLCAEKGWVKAMDEGRKKVWICILIAVLAAVVI